MSLPLRGFGPLLLILHFAFNALWASGQEGSTALEGKVVESDTYTPVARAIVSVYDAEAYKTKGEGATPIAYALSGQEGAFELVLNNPGTQLILTVKKMGFETLVESLSMVPEEPILFRLKPRSEELPEVVVVGPPIVATKDTVSYRADAFVTSNTYSLEDLVKRLPGLTVDSKGTISYMGESIQGVYIEGLDLVANSYRTATRIIKAEEVSSIDVMEHFQPIKMLRGIEEQKGAMLNIKLKNNRMFTPSGESSGSLGSLDEKELLYDLTANLLLVNNRTQLIAGGEAGTAGKDLTIDAGLFSPLSKPAAKSLAEGTSFSQSSGKEDLHNQYGTVTVNQIFPIGNNETTIKYNAGFTHRYRDYGDGAEVLMNNGTDFTAYTDARNASQRRDAAALSLNYLHNTDALYLSNTVTVMGDAERLVHDVQRGGEPILEDIDAKGFQVEDNLTYLRRKGSDLIRYEGTVGYNRLPSLVMSVPEGSFKYGQKVGGSTLYGHTGIQYGFDPGGRYAFYGNLRAEGEIGSVGIYDLDQSEIATVRGGMMTLSTTPTLSFSGGKVRWSLRAPMGLLFFGYRSISKGAEDAATETKRIAFLPGLSFSLTYHAGSGWKVYGDAALRKRLSVSPTEFLLGTYYTSFDRKTTRTEVRLPESLSGSASFTGEYRNPIRGLFVRGTLSYVSDKSRTLSLTRVQGTTKEIIPVSVSGLRHNLSTDLFLSYKLPEGPGVFTVETGYGFTRIPLLMSTGSFSLVSHSVTLFPSFSADWSDSVETAFRGRVLCHIGTGSFERFSSAEWGLESSLYWNVLPALTLSVSNDTSIRKYGGDKPRLLSLLGAGITYRAPRYRISLRADNLFNYRRVYLPGFSGGDLSDAYQMLRPRQLLLSFSYKF